MRILPGRSVLPPTPPPDVDVEAWYRTLEEIERRAPERLALIHFGVAEDVGRHLAELRERLDTWAERVEEGATEDGVRRRRPGRPAAGGGGPATSARCRSGSRTPGCGGTGTSVRAAAS